MENKYVNKKIVCHTAVTEGGKAVTTVNKEYVVTYYGSNCLSIIDDFGDCQNLLFYEISNYFILYFN